MQVGVDFGWLLDRFIVDFKAKLEGGHQKLCQKQVMQVDGSQMTGWGPFSPPD